MSGGISFDGNRSWIVPTWAFRNVMGHAIKYISKESFSDLHSLMNDDENPLHFIFIEDLSSIEKEQLFLALRNGIEDIIKENGIDWENKELFTHFLVWCKELIEMLSG